MFRPTIKVLAVAALALASAAPAGSQGAIVTSGEVNTFAQGVGLGYDITGKARMIRTPSGKTIVSLQVKGLDPNTTYPTHVHKQACSNGNAGGHYQDVVGGAVDASNESWPTVSSNAAGNGQGMVVNDWYARPEAQAIVIHSTPTSIRLACVDLS